MVGSVEYIMGDIKMISFSFKSTLIWFHMMLFEGCSCTITSHHKQD